MTELLDEGPENGCRVPVPLVVVLAVEIGLGIVLAV